MVTGGLTCLDTLFCCNLQGLLQFATSYSPVIRSPIVHQYMSGSTKCSARVVLKSVNQEAGFSHSKPLGPLVRDFHALGRQNNHTMACEDVLPDFLYFPATLL